MSERILPESWDPVVMDAGLPLVEQGSTIYLELAHPDAAPGEIENKLIFRADQNRSDRLTWLWDNAVSSVIEPRKVRFPNGKTYYGFLLGGPVELTLISIAGNTVAEPECLRIAPALVIERIVAEKAGQAAIYFASIFDERYLAYDPSKRRTIAPAHLYEGPAHAPED